MEAKLAGINLNANDRKCDARSGVRWHRKPVRALSHRKRHDELVMLIEGIICSDHLYSMFRSVNARLTHRSDVFVLIQAAASDLAAVLRHSGPR
jgi:hypothetical protein